jgi:5'-nucleotidase/UDP-sugar diphosphatase
MSLSISLSRRLVLKAGASLAAAAAAPRFSSAQQGADFILISLADLHSPYAQLPRLLAQVRLIAAAAGDARVLILVNGDVFERGNVVALRSNGAADLAFLRALSEIAETVVNFGNHETALFDDPRDAREAIDRASWRIRMISSLIDARTGDQIVRPAAAFSVPGGELVILGVGTDQMMTYRAVPRGLIFAPRPATYVETWLPRVSQRPRAVVIASHAGVVADRAILSVAPPRSLVVGGHDHLRFDAEDAQGRRLFHGGAWGNHLRVVAIRVGADGPRFEIVELPLSAAADPALAAEIARQENAHLTAEDRAEIANLPRALDLAEATLVATEAVRKAANADVALLNHTSFGDGLPAGSVSKYRFDSFLRFDGDVRVATFDGATLAAILRGANQHKATTLEGRSGDFVYANDLAIDPAARYRVAANGWTTMNQQAYLGRTGLTFETVPGVMVKATVAKALKELPR